MIKISIVWIITILTDQRTVINLLKFNFYVSKYKLCIVYSITGTGFVSRHVNTSIAPDSKNIYLKLNFY